MPCDQPAVARAQFLEPLASVASYRLIAGNALPEEQALDPVDVSGPLGDQHLALAVDPAPVFVLHARHPDHRADTRFAPLVRQQRTHQRFAIDLVGLGTTASA